MTPRSGEIVALALPLLADVPRLRGFELPAPPALVGSWRAVGFETVTSRLSRLSRCPAVAFSASVEARTLPGFTCCPDEIPMMGSYYSPRPMTPMIQAREGRFIGVRAWGARRPASRGLELATQVSEPPPAKAEIPPRPQAEGAGNTVLPVEAPPSCGASSFLRPGMFHRGDHKILCFACRRKCPWNTVYRWIYTAIARLPARSGRGSRPWRGLQPRSGEAPGP